MQYYANEDAASFTGSGSNSFTGSGKLKGILRVASDAGGSASAGGSVGESAESHKSERFAAKERAKYLQSRINDMQKQSEKLEPQIAHYAKLSQRIDMGVMDREKALLQIKRLRDEQAVFSR